MFGFKKKQKSVSVDEKPRPSEEDLLKQYEEGRFLQVDNKKDNEEYFKSLGKKKK